MEPAGVRASTQGRVRSALRRGCAEATDDGRESARSYLGPRRPGARPRSLSRIRPEQARRVVRPQRRDRPVRGGEPRPHACHYPRPSEPYGSAGANRLSDAMLASAERFYRFWNTGDETLLRQAISESFVDHTLPPGRPQGPAGTPAPSKAVLAA